MSKGRYYKTKTTEFGELLPDSYQIVKDLLEENGKPIGYITGYQIFNELGLTTQVSAILQIGTIKDKKSTKRSYYRIKFVKQWNTITKENIPLLQLLDCLRFFKNIPDTMPKDSSQRLLYLLLELNDNQKNKIKKLAIKYTPQAIALLGAMLETLNPNEDVEKKNHLIFRHFMICQFRKTFYQRKKNGTYDEIARGQNIIHTVAQFFGKRSEYQT